MRATQMRSLFNGRDTPEAGNYKNISIDRYLNNLFELTIREIGVHLVSSPNSRYPQHLREYESAKMA